MTEGPTSTVQELLPARLGASAKGFSWRSEFTRRWKVLLVMLTLLAAGAAVWITLDARFLAYPASLAVQKADFILGPIGVGLYWRHRRPDNRMGLLLIILGLLGVPYILESSSNPVLFDVGVLAEGPIYVMTAIVILSFPSGRLGGVAERVVVAFLVATLAAVLVANVGTSHLAPSFSISGCRALCPGSGLGIGSPRSWGIPREAIGLLSVTAALATAAVIMWRFITGTAPRRRALAIGAPVALLFLFSEASYRALLLFAPNGSTGSERPIQSVLQWAVALTRSSIWYGFLFALVAAELYMARVLRRLVERSLGRPSFRELEGMLRGPLGDPGLRLGFRQEGASVWVDADGAVLAPARGDQAPTEVDQDGRPVVLIIHDKQLSDDPELLRVAGAVALLALENAELDAAWKDSLHALADSRARVTKASDKERRKLERDLHDGAQQRLLAALIRLSSADELADELADESPELKRQLTSTRVELEAAIGELRELARGIYPTVLAEVGLAGALRSVALRSPERLTVQATNRRFAAETEAAFYYCCLEAVQNTLKHAGSKAQTSIRLWATDGELRLEVRDTGPGFDPRTTPQDGMGLQSMRDRLSAVGGHLEIHARHGCGTTVTARAPDGSRSHLLTRFG